MFGSIKKNYVLEGLCCPNCAAKIKEKVKAIKDVKDVSLNAVTGEMVVKLAKKYTGNLKEEITHISVAVDEDIIVKEA